MSASTRRGVVRAGVTALATVFAVLFAALAGLGAVGLYRAIALPDNDDVAAAQIRFLRGAVAGGAGDRMAALFPEGAEFTSLITALADLGIARRGGIDTEGALASAREALALLDDPATADRFGVHDPPGGVFLLGWALQVSVARAELTGAASDRAEAATRAASLERALDAGTRSGRAFLASYPNQAWPVDTVGAVAALQRLQVLQPSAARADLLTRWRALALRSLDPRHGMLPHRVSATGGASIEGPRATSSSLMVLFWQDAFADRSAAVWQRYAAAFLVRRAGLLGVREHPSGTIGSGLGDVDSGPLVAGVSLSASAITLGAARRYGDNRVAGALQREAEVFGVPVQGFWPSAGRRYAAGALPVGDAFLAWARAQESSVEAGTATSPRTWIWCWPLAQTVIGAVLAWFALRRIGRYRKV